jgi:HEAT repeat protein
MRTIALMLVLAALLAVACTRATPSMAINNLNSSDPGVRQNAADSLRADAVPDEAIQPLIDAYQRDTDPHAKAAELIALGRSGSPAAKPLIDAYVRDAKNSDEQRWGGRALKYWMLQNKQIAADFKFPDGWPYGTPGYPPIIH